jgi:putative heme-binding domain-containing protein
MSQAFQRAHALWVLQRTGALEEATLREACRDRSEVVRVHAQRVIAERPTPGPESLTAARDGLKDADPNVQRVAAEALGQHPDPDNIRPLLDLRHAVPEGDTHLLHMVRMALRNQFRMAANWSRLPLQPWSERDARAIADVALGVPTPEAAAYLMQDMPTLAQLGDQLVPAVQHIARYGSPEATRTLLDFARDSQPDNLAAQVALYRALERGTQERGASLPPAARAWGLHLVERALASLPGNEMQMGIELVGTLRAEKHVAQVVKLATARSTPEPQRAAALTTLAMLDVGKHAGTLGEVLSDAESPISLREQAANLLARANAAPAQGQLLQVLPAAPARLQTVIAAGLAGSRQGAEKLLEAVATGKASARLLQERAVEVRLANAHIPGLTERIGKLTQGLPPADQRVQELLNRRRDGFRGAKTDVSLGIKVFEKHCANCHQIANKGARIGPQLDGIGIRGLDRLLEDTLDPNRNVDQAFRSTLLTLRNGQTFAGLLLKEEGEVLVLADNMGKEVRFPKSMVEERTTSQLSPMPANLVDQIPEEDFYHMLAYLLSQRVPPEKK